jgi:hypothetical protein
MSDYKRPTPLVAREVHKKLDMVERELLTLRAKVDDGSINLWKFGKWLMLVGTHFFTAPEEYIGDIRDEDIPPESRVQDGAN